jgi:hypothetical protein
MRCTCGRENPESANRCSQCGRSLRGENKLGRTLMDAAAAAGLVLALAVVFALQRGGKSSEENGLKTGPADVQTLGENEKPARVRPLRLAVTPKQYDDMGKLLGELGTGYRWESIRYDDLLDPDVLSDYDVVFLTCGGLPPRWLGRRMAEGTRPGSDLRRIRPRIREQLRESLRSFVGRGGTLYASDWRFKVLAVAFPEMIDWPVAVRGDVQTVQADVLDAGLERRLGRQIELNFDKPSWDPAAFRGPEVITYLRGTYNTVEGDRRAAPLLIKFPYEKGTVIFTSFHNEKQHSNTERELLKYLVFASVTAREDADVRRTMVRGGFSPVEGNLLSASAGDQSVTQTYQAATAGDLQFVLGFADRGARLRLSVTGPDGRALEKTGTSTFVIDVPDAPAGQWRYTITPLEVPYRNFPFSLTVGQKQ